VWDVVKFITNHHKPLAIYREIGNALVDKPLGGTELIKYCETRFASKIMMITRYYNCLPILEAMMINPTFTAWVNKQKRETKSTAIEIRRIIRSEANTEAVKICIKVLDPVLRLLRLTDSKTGATLSKLYGYMIQIDVFYRKEIPGLEDNIRKKMHALFMARWEYFHVPMMTAAFRFDPEFSRREFDNNEVQEVRAVLRKMATREHTVAAINADLPDFEDALSMGTDDLTDEVAFSESARAMSPYKWARIYLTKWPHLRYAVVRLLALSCLASGCEDSWSVESWIHSKKRNRLGQRVVERLVRAHTNIILDQHMKAIEENGMVVLPWDLEMIIDDPDDESDEDASNDK
jgi:hypothetical protein